MFDFNDSQLQALDLTQHVVLTAAAGSGKTSVLVERFVRLLESNDFKPQQIVALTFTQEAAREMRRRIGQAIRDRAQRHSEGTENPWQEAGRQLSQASITTIHGFCLQILQGNFERVGLDPETRLLSPAEQPVLLTETIQDCMQEAALEKDCDLALLLDACSVSLIQGSLFELASRRNAFRDVLCKNEPYLELTQAYQSEASHWILQSAEWKMLEATLRGLPPALLQAPGTMSRRCRDQISWLERRGFLSDAELVEGVASTLAQRFSPSRVWKESSGREPIKQSWKGLKAVLARHPLQFDSPRPDEDDCFFAATGALRRLFHRVLESYTQAKRKLLAIDFEDILDHARLLLRSTNVASRLQRRYPVLLVDEFQDTNQVQWDILGGLIGPASNFLAVGDDKQSIYRFRQADVAVFRQVQRWVTRFGKTVAIPENYRSTPELIDFNNHVFSQLFTGGLEYEAVHQKMVASGTPKSPGGVEIFLYEPEDPIPEAVRVAAWIEQLVEAGRAPSEIAILLRTRNRLKLYEEALAAKGIPFDTVAGAGFFESQEVLDSIGLLRWLADPDADIALLGLLRSPFFNLSDTQVLSLAGAAQGNLNAAQVRGGMSRWLMDQVPTSIRDSSLDQQTRFARGLMARWKRSAEIGTSPSQLLRQAYRETGYEHTLATSRRADVGLGNLHKFSKLVFDFEQHRSRSLRELVRFLDGILICGGNEPESDISGERGGGVRIYTIHGAKGLEFPVVLLPELGVPFSAAPADQFQLFTEHPEFPGMALMGFLMRNSTDSYRELEHPHFRVLQKLSSYRQLAEEKRLLYVAMTRSQEQLLLLGSLGRIDSYAGWLVECGVERFQVHHSFLVKTEGVGELIGQDAFEIPSQRSLEVGRGSTPRSDDDPNAESASVFPNSGLPAFDEISPLADDALAPLAIPVRPRTVWSATQITAFLNCPRRFYLAEVERIPDQEELSLLPTVSESALVGTAVHLILEKEPLLDDWPAVERMAQGCGWRGASNDSQRRVLSQRIMGHLRRIRGHPLFDRIRQAEESYSEREFNLVIAGRHVQGVIDRSFREGSGRWVVVDFKTSRPSPPTQRENVSQSQNQQQLEIYLAAIHQILEPEVLEGWLFFSANGHVEQLSWDRELQNRVEEWVRQLPLDESEPVYPKTRHQEHCGQCPFLSNGHCSGATAVQQRLW